MRLKQFFLLEDGLVLLLRSLHLLFVVGYDGGLVSLAGSDWLSWLFLGFL